MLLYNCLKYEGITKETKEITTPTILDWKYLFPDSIMLIGSDSSAEVPNDGVFSLECYL